MIDFDKSGVKLGGTLHFRRHIEGLELTVQLIMFTVFWNVMSYILVVGASVSEELLVAEHFKYSCFLGLLTSVTDGSWHAL